MEKLKNLISILLLFYSISLFSQEKIYKDFNENMSKSEVLVNYAKNKERLDRIEFTKDISWRISVDRFQFTENDQLKVVTLIPADMGNGYNYIKTVTHLTKSKNFLESLGYEVVYENELWNRPQSFVDQNLPYAIILQNPSNLNYVSIYTKKEKGSYIPLMYIFKKDYLKKHFQDNQESKNIETGF